MREEEKNLTLASEERHYDAIIVGAGIAGLTTAAFLAREGKKVLVIEKHDKPGGYVTSFKRKDYTFESSLYHAPNLSEKEFIVQFINYWGGEIKTTRNKYRIKHFLGEMEFSIDDEHVIDNLVSYFPEEEANIRKFFDIGERIMNERFRMGPPAPLYEMSLLDKIVFGIKSLFFMPTNMKYMSLPAVETIKSLFKNKTLANIIFGLDPVKIFFLSPIYIWWSLNQGQFYSPVGGFQFLSDTIAKTIQENGGEIRLKTEVSRVIIKNGTAIGVECKNGDKYYGKKVISNSPIHHTLNQLTVDEPRLDPLRKRIRNYPVHVSVMMNFVGVDAEYDFQGYNWFVFTDENTIDLDEKDITPHNCPLHMIVLPPKEGQKDHSVLIPAFIPYDYMENWGAEDGKRGKRYQELKEEAQRIVLDRICNKMGPEFRKAIKYKLASTPLTYERYTYNKKGACMGWFQDKKYFSRLLSPITPVKELYLVGHYVFPGGGVPNVVVCGYYLASRLLKEEGVNLNKNLDEYFAVKNH